MLISDYKDFIEKNEDILMEQACMIVVGTVERTKTLLFIAIKGYKDVKHKDN